MRNGSHFCSLLSWTLFHHIINEIIKKQNQVSFQFPYPQSLLFQILLILSPLPLHVISLSLFLSLLNLCYNIYLVEKDNKSGTTQDHKWLKSGNKILQEKSQVLFSFFTYPPLSLHLSWIALSVIRNSFCLRIKDHISKMKTL